MTDLKKQLVGLTTFVQLEKNARKAETIQRLQFVIANETFKLINYRQAIVWSIRHDGNIRLVTASGISQFDSNAPFIQWVGNWLADESKKLESSAIQLSINDIDKSLHSDWKNYINGYVLLCPLITSQGNSLGGVLLIRQDPWENAEISLIQMLMEAYAHAWFTLLPHNKRYKKSGLVHAVKKRGLKQVVLVLIAIALFIPVQQSVLAPASIVPIKPKSIASPMEGVIEKILVSPNEEVDHGQVLLKIDDNKLLSQVNLASKAYEVAKAEHFKAIQKSFGNTETKGEVTVLKAKMDQKASEIDYYQRLLSKTTVLSPERGVVIFTNANDWEGKPVVLGEKVMELAKVNEVQIEVWLQVDDAINLEINSEVLLFLNTDPTSPVHAKLTRISYQPEINDKNILAFRMLAEINSDQPLPRLGLQGTAKLYGESVPVIYYLLRRPAAKLRQWTGL